MAKQKVVDLNKPVIGACEYVSLPELDIPRIKARVDTGARTSALHAYDIEAFRRGGERWVRFRVHTGDTDFSPSVKNEAPVVDYRRVKNTSGTSEKRFVIQTLFRLGSTEWQCELTLADRERMRFPMLLGRLAIRGRFLVDPDHVFIHGRRPKQAKADR